MLKAIRAAFEGKGKVHSVLEEVMKAQRRSRGLALLFL
jgi:hypothetical protein